MEGPAYDGSFGGGNEEAEADAESGGEEENEKLAVEDDLWAVGNDFGGVIDVEDEAVEHGDDGADGDADEAEEWDESDGDDDVEAGFDEGGGGDFFEFVGGVSEVEMGEFQKIEGFGDDKEDAEKRLRIVGVGKVGGVKFDEWSDEESGDTED